MAENGPVGAPFLAPKIPPKKFMWVLCCVLFQEMRHIHFFSGGSKWGVLGGGQKVYVEKVYVLFPSPYSSCMSGQIRRGLARLRQVDQVR